LFGRRFVFSGLRQTWADHRVFLLDGQGGQHSMPVGWTDAAPPDIFVEMAAGRSAFRVSDLIELTVLVEQLDQGPAEAGPLSGSDPRT
jgi:hypothetical protein